MLNNPILENFLHTDMVLTVEDVMKTLQAMLDSGDITKDTPVVAVDAHNVYSAPDCFAVDVLENENGEMLEQTAVCFGL